MEENKVVEEIFALPKKEVLAVLFAYDEYVFQVVNENYGEPVGVCEFYENDYQEYVKGKE